MYLTQPDPPGPLPGVRGRPGPGRADGQRVVLAIAGASASTGRSPTRWAGGGSSPPPSGCWPWPPPPAPWPRRCRRWWRSGRCRGSSCPGMTAVSVAYAGDRWDAVELWPVVGGLIGASVVGRPARPRRRPGPSPPTPAGGPPSSAFAALTALAAPLGAGRELSPPRAAGRGRLGAAWRGMLDHLSLRRLVGAYLVGATMFFGWMGLFTYLPYLLSAAPSASPPGWCRASSSSTRSAWWSPRWPAGSPPGWRRRLVAIGLTVEGIGLPATLHAALPVLHRGAGAGGGRDLHGAGGGARLRQPAGAPRQGRAPAPST